jgi:hypothetical protein
MGLFDKFSSDERTGTPSGAPGEAEQYGMDDLGDQVAVWFLDRWPVNKTIFDHDLVYMEDPELETPVVLHCPEDLPLPEGTRILPYDEAVAAEAEGTTFYINRGLLVHPHVVMHLDADEQLNLMPASMSGANITARDGRDSEWVQSFADIWASENVDEDGGPGAHGHGHGHHGHGHGHHGHGSH